MDFIYLNKEPYVYNRKAIKQKATILSSLTLNHTHVNRGESKYTHNESRIHQNKRNKQGFAQVQSVNCTVCNSLMCFMSKRFQSNAAKNVFERRPLC